MYFIRENSKNMSGMQVSFVNEAPAGKAWHRQCLPADLDTFPNFRFWDGKTKENFFSKLAEGHSTRS
jgi:hypothetical protein